MSVLGFEQIQCHNFETNQLVYCVISWCLKYFLGLRNPYSFHCCVTFSFLLTVVAGAHGSLFGCVATGCLAAPLG